MRSRRAICALLFCTLFAAASVPAGADSDYSLLDHGLAPGKQMSLASHGKSESGTFHVWLMEEPNHRKIAALPGIVETYHDSTPTAVWSNDQHRVAVIFRSSRNREEFRLYDIDGHRVRSISGPRPFKEVTGRDVADGDGAYLRYYAIEWRSPNGFVLREYQSFDPAPDADLLRLLAGYGHASKGTPSVIEFAAEADCLLDSDHHYRVVELRPRNPDVPLNR